MTIIIGIDYSGARDDRNTWVARGHLTEDNELELYSAQPVRREDVFDVLAAAPTPAVAAIDFPFGVPREFAKLLNTGDSIEAMPDVWSIIANMSLDDFIKFRDAFVDRFGEHKRAGDAAHFSESFSPLHKVNPNMLPMTYHGIRTLYECYHYAPNRWNMPPLESPADPSDTTTLIETMPGAFLNAIGFRRGTTKGYKRARLAVQRRDYIINNLAAKSGIPLPTLGRVRLGCRANDDCLDAVVAAVAAASWALHPERFRHPDADELAAAKLEGWIYAPQPTHY